MTTDNHMPRRSIRRKLLTTVSALALCASALGFDPAWATDADRATIWIDLGAQFEKISGFGDPYDPPYTAQVIADGFMSPLKAERALSRSFGEEGTISFQPQNSDWIFSAAIRYGRANGGSTKHQQTPGGQRKVCIGSNCGYLSARHGTVRFSETNVSNSELHTVLDFQAGKDLGLGLLGVESKSVVGFGLRFAQFGSKQNANLRADPDFYFPSQIAQHAKYQHTYAITSHMERSFHGVGPSISWNASVPLIGNAESSEVTLDWGANAAVLFGRQKARGHHQTVGAFYRYRVFKYSSSTHFQHSGNPDRSRSIVVPNVGGFAGISFRYSDAKISFGYRGDFFFGAMDGGIDTRKSTTLGFNGPFASISFGLGD
ncbi:MAG TPA: hypothetical protein VGT78_05315 [Rhizomicrobium sp.]|nr:hypothetical protein [Rhizomicrobium sp.]